MKWRIFTTLFTLSLIILLFNHSYALQISVENVKDQIIAGDTLLYNIHVTNNEKVTRNVYLAIYPSEEYQLRWNYSSLTNAFSFNIKPGEEVIVPLEIKTTENYRYPEKVTFRCFVKDFGEVRLYGKIWVITISNLSFPSEIDPREYHELSVVVYSNLEQDITQKKLEIYKDGELILSKEVEKNLIPGQNNIPMIIKLNDTQEPGNYKILFSIRLLNSTVGKSTNFTVLGYKKLVLVDQRESSGIGGREMFVTWRNEGTLPVTKKVEFNLSSLDMLLLSEAAPGFKKEDNRIVYEFTLAPGEEKTVYVKISYLPLLLIPIVIIIVGGILIYMRKGIILEKEITEKRHVDDKIEAKVSIRIKNTTSKTLSEVELIDRLPKFVHEIGAFTSRATLNKKKRTLRWEFTEISPGEEIIISYKIRTRLHLIGEILMPPVTMKYKIGEKSYSLDSGYVKTEFG